MPETKNFDGRPNSGLEPLCNSTICVQKGCNVEASHEVIYVLNDVVT